jgi:hypothetical protein
MIIFLESMSHHFVTCLVRRIIFRSGDISFCNKILYSYNHVYEYITRQMLIHDNMYCPGCTPYLANTCQSRINDVDLEADSGNKPASTVVPMVSYGIRPDLRKVA